MKKTLLLSAFTATALAFSMAAPAEAATKKAKAEPVGAGPVGSVSCLLSSVGSILGAKSTCPQTAKAEKGKKSAKAGKKSGKKSKKG